MSFRKLKCLLLLIMNLELAFAAEITPYIINGQDANIDNFPSFASLFYKNGNVYSTRSFCGATIINQEYVLTAAHCVYDDDLMLHMIVIPNLNDELDLFTKEGIRAKEFYYLDTFRNTSDTLWKDDIAIIKLEKPVLSMNYYNLINKSETNLNSNEKYIAIGHGDTNSEGENGTKLKKTELSFVDNDECKNIYGSLITRNHLCFEGNLLGKSRNSICDGDSGGPIYLNNGNEYIQIGIASFGPIVCGDQKINITSVFTNLYEYQSWIEQVLNNKIPPQVYINTKDGSRVLNYNDKKTDKKIQKVSAGSFNSITIIVLFFLLILSNDRTKLYEYYLWVKCKD
ncbi:trypsin-like serine protease [Vibrio sp. YMD68]|uniref:S1 family peptidase n=1 Tax=Vibrio sp. YMD68 TaxID=3042300 RepID=UPI002499AE09|nr:trypsin-like serine protease [Vibrio sp. YMD68]WGW01381.1 trypsin-like serine protease [Vibrio sp. YMD68]